MPILLPLKVEAGQPILRGWDFLWSTIREAGRNGRRFTVSELDLAGNDRHRRNASDYVRRLVAAGIAEEVGWAETADSRRRRATPARLYRLVRRPLETPHLKRDGSEALGRGRAQAMWNAIRALKTFTTRELAVAASTEERPVTTVYAGHYARALRDAGYLASLGDRTYRLKPSMNTGPKAPTLLSARVVYDPNRGSVANRVIAEEVES